jgi:diguanylate cyclase (GGDEF)-like protein
MTKVLIIEDDYTIRDSLNDLLDAVGYEVLAASNGHQGLQLAQQERPDLIICDVRMPGLDGYSLLLAVRQHAELSLVPFIFLTACGNKAEYRQGMELGADDYLVKPFSRKEVLQAIQTQLEKRERMINALNNKLMRAEAVVDYLTHYDELTRLPNKFALEKQFAELQREYANRPGQIVLMILSIDHLNRVQNALGDRCKDLVLQGVANRLQNVIHAPNSLGYLGENQFAILILNVAQLSAGLDFGEVIRAACANPFLVDDRSLFITFSLGSTQAAIATADFTELQIQANLAKEEALRLGGNQARSYQPHLNQHLQQNIIIRSELHQALDREQFCLYYQPIVELKSGFMLGAEALIRWQHPEQGFISPEQFIPIAEESGLIVPLGEWVLEQAVRDVKRWNMISDRAILVSINVSARQLESQPFTDFVAELIHREKVAPAWIKLELTESILLQNPETIQAKIELLKATGLKFALDDFGTGYSSFSYIQQLAFDIIKIDRSFVQGIDHNPKNAAIALAVLQMTHNLNCQVIAEGVATADELQFLQRYRCDAIQGYFFSPPLATDVFDSLLATRPHFELP